MEAIAITQLLIIVALQLFLQQRSSPTNQRRACLKRKRIDWECRAQPLEDSNSFERCYKMSRASFDALLDLLSPALVVDEQQSMNRTGIDHVTPVNKLQMFLRYISGGSYHDTIAYSGVGKTTFHDCIQEVMDALLAHPQLQIKFPEDEEGVESLADGFQGVSNGGVMVGCVGAINGWLCPIIVPSVKEAPKVRSFYSGHYRCYGVNVQACCDHMSRFTSVAIVSIGGCGDSVAFQEWGFSAIVKRLKFGQYVVGDNAYANSNSLLTPHSVPSVNGDIYKDSFNFHLSQLRIRIEMAFGLLVRKWRIFRSPLQVEFANVSRVVMCGCILHNWCINRRLLEDAAYRVDRDDELVNATLEPRRTHSSSTVDQSRYRDLYDSPIGEAVADLQNREQDPNLLRDAFVSKLRGRMQMRPRNNIARRARETRN